MPTTRGLLAGCLALVALFAFAPATAQAQDGGAVRFGPGDFAGLVGIGDGRKMYVECHGRGRPTVILEAGLRSRGDFWMPTEETTGTAVATGVARFTRACILDRPGTTLGAEAFSRSDPVRMPRTAADTVADLRALIRAAGIRGPLVLAGHSTGGLIVRLFASTYPGRVVGMVQVDALNEFLADEFTPGQLAVFDTINNGPLPGSRATPTWSRSSSGRASREMRRAKRREPLR